MVPKSYFASILHTNYVPSAKELGELQDLVLEPRDRIQRLDEEIHCLQVERDELQQFVDDHSALRAPFRRLPADIWGEIFVYCLPTNKLDVALCTAKEHPLLLTTICRSWREVALNTPRLWSALHIHVPGINPNPTFPARLEGIKLWLKRSGSRPLTLSISMSDHTPSNAPAVTDFDSSPYTALMDLLARYSHRWRTLSFDSGVRSSHLRPLERFTGADLPLLETVYIGKSLLLEATASSTPPASSHETPSSLANLLPQLPSLRSLHSQPGCNLAVEIASNYRLLTQLTVSLAIPPGTALRQIAMSCRCLRTLTIQSFYYSSVEDGAAAALLPPTEDPVDWPSLHELNFQLEGYYTTSYETGPKFHPGTFDSILTPHLHRLFLQLGQFSSHPVADLVTLQGFITSSPRLTHLHILGYNALDAEALSRCLQFTPSLETFKLRPCTRFYPGRRPHSTRRRRVVHPPPEWVPKLLSTLNELESLPKMETFDFGGCIPDNISSLLEFAQGHRGRSSTLKQLRADLGSLGKEEAQTASSADLAERMNILRETKGVSVDLEWTAAKTSKPDDPAKGMPNENSPWASDSYLY
ncbi:hypothetical protein PQX77_005663 [Marasmius sp. AFHP31]|nr:hypothetical protein PQX77_005663 [Marasmius sp. AFHP31]